MNISHLPQLLAVLFASDDTVEQERFFSSMENVPLSEAEADALSHFFLTALKGKTSQRELFIKGLHILLNKPRENSSSDLMSKLFIALLSSENQTLQARTKQIYQVATKEEQEALKTNLLSQTLFADKEQKEALSGIYQQINNLSVTKTLTPQTVQTPTIPSAVPTPKIPLPRLDTSDSKRKRKLTEEKRKKKKVEKNIGIPDAAEEIAPQPQTTYPLNPNILVRFKQQIKTVKLALLKGLSEDSLDRKLSEWGYLTDTSQLSSEDKQRHKTQNTLFSDVLEKFITDSRPSSEKRKEMEEKAESVWQEHNEALALFILFVADNYNYMLRVGYCKGNVEDDLAIIKSSLCKELTQKFKQIHRSSKPSSTTTLDKKENSSTPIEIESSEEDNDNEEHLKQSKNVEDESIPFSKELSDLLDSELKKLDLPSEEKTPTAPINPVSANHKKPEDSPQPSAEKLLPEEKRTSIRILAKKLGQDEKLDSLAKLHPPKEKSVSKPVKNKKTIEAPDNQSIQTTTHRFFKAPLKGSSRPLPHKMGDPQPFLLRNLPHEQDLKIHGQMVHLPRPPVPKKTQ